MSKKLLVSLVIALFTAALVLAQEAGSDSIGDEFYPTLGNGGYDVQHYKLDIDVDDDLEELTATVTITQTSHDHRPLYMFSAMSLALVESAIMASALGSTFTHAHMPIDETVPASSPQKPPAGVARFHNMPSSTVPNSGAMKKLNSACT